MRNIRMSSCGFAGSVKEYHEKFRAGEIQQTFIEQPRLSTAERCENILSSLRIHPPTEAV